LGKAFIFSPFRVKKIVDALPFISSHRPLIVSFIVLGNKKLIVFTTLSCGELNNIDFQAKKVIYCFLELGGNESKTT
jgi:hypothetical protein